MCFFCSSLNNRQLGLYRPVVGVWLTWLQSGDQGARSPRRSIVMATGRELVSDFQKFQICLLLLYYALRASEQGQLLC